MKRIIAITAALIAATAATPANAQCQWRWDCTNGQCRQVPICRSAIDLPPLRPLELPPLPTPTLRPLPTPQLPPLGTRQCTQRYICANGQCQWQQVCQ
jgi:hypothetical protein